MASVCPILLSEACIRKVNRKNQSGTKTCRLLAASPCDEFELLLRFIEKSMKILLGGNDKAFIYQKDGKLQTRVGKHI